MIRVISVPLAMLLVASGGCSERPSPRPSTGQAAADTLNAGRIPAADEPPAALLQLGQSATDLFDSARSADWRQASASLQAVNEAASNLPADLQDAGLVANLQSRLVSVREATNDRRQLETMEGANAITHIVAELAQKYRPEVPYEVRMLGYYGRQIELGVASGDSTIARRAASDLTEAWNRIQPEMDRRGQPEDARRFTAIVVRLMNARQPADFGAPAADELAALRHLESLFAK
jgi:hypothetical protein